MNKFTIIPSNLEYKAAPAVDQEISFTIEEQSQQLIEYDRNSTISLAQVYDDERQACTIFRPTFKLTYLYANTYTGTTDYLPFQYNLYYTTPENSYVSGIWAGFPQYYEFDFFRPDIKDQHITYKSKSAYTYNWTYYVSYPYANNYTKQLSFVSGGTANIVWTASDGIPFVIKNGTENGNNVIGFQCIAPHGLTAGEYVELSFSYGITNIFEVNSLGNGMFGSDANVFNIFNIGYTGNTFVNNKTGTFKRIVNPDNYTETKSKYYVREHKILTNLEDIIITKAGFEKNVFNEERKFEYSSITPNQISRVSQKTSSNAYNVTINYDLDLYGYKDNQQRPLTQIFLTVVNKGYSGYFNQPFNGVGLKQGWEFNMTKTSNSWWDLNNINSNTTIPVSGYTLTSGATKTFYYNQNLKSGDTMDGDFCEWNDYEQIERVVSPYYHKLKYNENVFHTTTTSNTNAPGYYYQPHQPMTIRVFSDYIETANSASVDQIPSYSFYSSSDQQFRWRDLYTYGFIDNLNRGVDYPYLNIAQYPFTDVIFRLIPEGVNYNQNLFGTQVVLKPLIDGCE